MNPVTISIGVAALGYGIFTIYVRATNPSKFGKLAAMKKQWGERTGNAVHVVSYTVVPIVVGVSLIVAGVLGVSFFGG